MRARRYHIHYSLLLGGTCIQPPHLLTPSAAPPPHGAPSASPHLPYPPRTYIRRAVCTCRSVSRASPMQSTARPLAPRTPCLAHLPPTLSRPSSSPPPCPYGRRVRPVGTCTALRGPPGRTARTDRVALAERLALADRLRRCGAPPHSLALAHARRPPRSGPQPRHIDTAPTSHIRLVAFAQRRWHRTASVSHRTASVSHARPQSAISLHQSCISRASALHRNCISLASVVHQ